MTVAAVEPVNLPAPAFLRSDNGPEFVSTAIQEWLSEVRIDTALIDPGKPWQNANNGTAAHGKFPRRPRTAGSGRELPVGPSSIRTTLQTFGHGIPTTCFVLSQINRSFRAAALVLPTSFRLLVAASFLIAASIRLASDWFRQANLRSSRRGGFALV